jgi:hypothetical protein
MIIKLDTNEGKFNIEFEGIEPKIMYQYPEIMIRQLDLFSNYLNKHKEELVRTWNSNFEKYMCNRIKTWVTHNDNNEVIINYTISNL